MSKFAINPNALPDPLLEQAAALDRDRAALHHFDNDGAGETSLADGRGCGPLLVMPDPRYRHGDIDVVEAKLAARKTSGAAPTPAQPGAGRAKATDDPLIASLVAALPPPGGAWSGAARARWLRAAAGVFGLVYADGPEAG